VGVNATRLPAIVAFHNAPDFRGYTNLETGLVLELGDSWSGE
jgi:hypothetical protein